MSCCAIPTALEGFRFEWFEIPRPWNYVNIQIEEKWRNGQCQVVWSFLTGEATKA